MKPRSRAPDIAALVAAAGLLVWFLRVKPIENLSEVLLVTSFFSFGGWLLRGVDASGAIAGAAVTFIFFGTGGWPLFACLIAAFLTTLIATRAGKRRKQALRLTEGSRRNAAQIMANLAVPAALIVRTAQLFVHRRIDDHRDYLPLLMAIAALAQAAADTVSSEIGEAFGGTPRLITSGRKTEVGANGAITSTGTAAGIFAALIVVSVFRGALEWRNFNVFLLLPVAATCGMMFDSILGATLESKRWLNNDLVNLLGTASAALAAYWLLSFLHGDWV